MTSHSSPSPGAATPGAHLRIAGLISGGGRTLLNLHDAIGRGELDAEIAVVIASRPDIAGVERIRARDVPVVCPARDDHDAISAVLQDAAVDLICLCGYLRWLRIDSWMRGRVINIHPSLLPAHGGHGMFGNRVHTAVLAAGDAESGCTVHFVDEEYDHGPTILQRRCPVEPGDEVRTLAARVFAEERIAFPEVIRAIAGGRVRMDQGQAVWSDPPAQATAARR